MRSDPSLECDEGDTANTPARVTAVHLSRTHSFSKQAVSAIQLLEGIGVEGDAHSGVTVQHRSRVAADPSQPNLRQVHLIHSELFDLLGRAGHRVAPGQLGENITTIGIDLLGLPVGTRLGFRAAEITITGLRNPCQQINGFQDGLLKQVLRKDSYGAVQRLAGVMAIVSRGGSVQAGDHITQTLPPLPHFPLARV